MCRVPSTGARNSESVSVWARLHPLFVYLAAVEFDLTCCCDVCLPMRETCARCVGYALQELHVSNCQGITAADLEAVASTVANSLTLLDISRNAFQPDGGDLRGSIDALGRLTNLQDLKAFGSCIAPVGDGSEGGVCNILAQLTQLTFLTVGNVLRSVMVMPADDVAHLSKLSKLEKLHLAGAQLGVGVGRKLGPWLCPQCCSLFDLVYTVRDFVTAPVTWLVWKLHFKPVSFLLGGCVLWYANSAVL